MKLTDIFSAAQLDEAHSEGWIVRRQHPHEPLAILNYTEAAVFARAWNPCTLSARGLIYNEETGRVVARPFRKFFNYGEPSAPELDLSARVLVTDKLDGSQGVLYPTSIGHGIATRGSFESEQAIHATQVWRERYEHFFEVPVGLTLLFEIIYPTNRIVLDYGQEDDLHLLGAIETASGESLDPHHPRLRHWPGPRAYMFDYETLADALAAEPRANAEGLVLFFPETGDRLKLKQADYVALHRIVTGLNERTVWEHLRIGGKLEELIAPLPDEFHDWTREVAARLVALVDAQTLEIEREFMALIAVLEERVLGYTRKDFAELACRSERKAHLFARLDEKDYTGFIWDAIKPAPFRGPRMWAE